MTEKRKVYKNPQSAQPLLSTISSGCTTPILEVKFCNMVRPYYYPNSPTIARYSITCTIDPVVHKDFINGIRTIEKNENVSSIIKNDTHAMKDKSSLVKSPFLLIKFQSKDIIPIYLCRIDKEIEEIELEDELARGERVSVLYDILRYTKKDTVNPEHGLSFKPISIFYHAQEE